MDEERQLSGGLGAAIFLMPQLFGWLVFRHGYNWSVRLVVAVYMILSSIPLYFLIVTLWGSGGEIRQLARDYDSNRAVATRNADRAFDYMREYQAQDTATPSGATPEGAAGQPRPAGAPVDARQLAAEVETGAFKSRSGPLAVRGLASAKPAGNTVFLEGSEAYPAVRLTYQSAAPSVEAGSEVTATCQTVTLGTAGPELGGCL